jgi:hypothetical protein
MKQDVCIDVFHIQPSLNGVWICETCNSVNVNIGGERDYVPPVQGAGWASGLIWISPENLFPTGVRTQVRPAYSESLCQLRYISRNCRKQSSLGKEDIYSGPS